MTQETINKLYQLLNYKSKWVTFKSKFDFNQNIAIVKKDSDGVFCTNPDTDIVIYPECIDDWNDYQEYMKSQNKAKSTLIINIEPKNKNNLKNELIKKIKKFFFSIGDMNNYKGEVNYSNIEEIIEKDFKEEIKK
jgi:hypothetical protein